MKKEGGLIRAGRSNFNAPLRQDESYYCDSYDYTERSRIPLQLTPHIAVQKAVEPCDP